MIPRPTVDKHSAIEETPAAAEDEWRRVLRREADELASDPADRAAIVELRADLGDPWADLAP